LYANLNIGWNANGLFVATSRFSGLTPDAFFGIACWIGFVSHLIAAEVWLQWTRPQPVHTLVVKD